MKPIPPALPAALVRPVQKAMREHSGIRAALARLQPADRAHIAKAIGDAIAAKLARDGRRT